MLIWMHCSLLPQSIDVKAVRIFLLLVICQIVVILAPVRAVWSLLTRNDDRAWEIVKAYDRLGNAAMNGDGHETLSSRANRGREENERWACVLCKILDKIQENHCANSKGV